MRSAAFKIAAIYIVVALAWIALSDNLLDMVHISANRANMVYLNIAKGSLYVIFTGVMLYKLIDKYNSRLAASEQQYRSYFDNNPSPMWIYRQDTLQFTDVNDAAVNHYGYTRDEFKQMRVLDIRPTQYRKELSKIIKTLPEGYNDVGTWVHQKKNGDLIDVQISLQHIKNNGENKIMVLAKDVTELKRLEQEKNDYLLRLEDTLNSISDAFFLLDKNWNISMANAMFEKISGLKRTDVNGKNFMQVWPNGADSPFYHHYKKALSEKITVKFEGYGINVKKWLSMSCYPTQEGLAVYLTDITESKEKDLKLELALERYNQAAAASQDMLYEFDLLTNKVSYSETKGHFIGLEKYIISDPANAWLSLVHVDDLPVLTSTMAKALSANATKYACEYRVNCGNVNYRWVSDKASIIYNEQQQPLRMVGSIRDINDIKEQEESLKHQNNILREIAWIESHEIRRPLASILGLVELANTCNREELNEVLSYLKFSADELDQMVRKITSKIDEAEVDN
ncbi:PAS domain S-box protein [Mucilaginibacter auburnensis]|uniref:histidine kinase n=1 Tax=Mucilaginibacter auburnensis TaxID=1457233 RepID=A0A2H9VVV7_9SPHI|nr:PAS domain S-box protein [Mucilaginibacter auburnensis]PJJ84950.1 PAS domain S-box-containing protein [Mucilaginibacter auburnensis]